jgi:hypothetical protein
MTIDLHSISHVCGIVLITFVLLSAMGAIEESAKRAGINGFYLIVFMVAFLALGVWLL